MKFLYFLIFALFAIGLININSVNGILINNTFVGNYIIKNDLAIINNQTYYISKPYDTYYSNQTIIFHNVFFTMPTTYTNPPDPSGAVFSLVKFPDGSTEKLGVGFPVAYPLTDLSSHLDPQAAFTRFTNGTFVFLVSKNLQSLSPLKQFQSGIDAQNVKCEQDLKLIIKLADGSPACVTAATAKVLTERGWGHLS